MQYFLPLDPATPVFLPNLRRRAKRVGYRISHDRNIGAFTLVDCRNAIEAAQHLAP